MQKCWEVLGELYYHYEATDFLEPVTPDQFGEDLYEEYLEYCQIVKNPMDISSVMNKMRGFEYPTQNHFRNDILLIFTNCRAFNEADTEIVNSANTLERVFNKQWNEKGL